MSDKNRPFVLVLGQIPGELSSALIRKFDLVERAGLPEAAHSEFEVAVTTSMLGADAATLRAFPNLRLLACNGAGLDQIDMDEAARRKIEVCNTPDAVTTDTADYAIGLVFATRRRLVAADQFVRSRRWEKERWAPTDRVTGCSLGIVGIGRLGKAIAVRAAALGMKVSYTARGEKTDLPYRFIDDLGALAAVSDVLIAACPGGEETRGLIDARILERLGASGILINISRGSVVDEAALIAALKNKIIRAAALDVFEGEPMVNPDLCGIENLLLSPHAAAATLDTRHDIAATLERRISRYFATR